MDINGPNDVELVHWLDLDEWGVRERIPADDTLSTFEDVARAIDKNGPLEAYTDRVNLFFMRTSGRFEEEIVVVRQSGLNVRRILLSKGTFELYGDYRGCVDHLLSNNAIGPEVEYAHIKDFGRERGLSANVVDPKRHYTRLEIDTTATLQMLALRDDVLSANPENAELVEFVFDAGFTAGRNFSAVQNLATLETNARYAMEAKRKNAAKGKKSGSAERRLRRMQAFIDEIEAVYEQNQAIQAYEDVVMRVAFDRAVPPGQYGHGQFDSYCTSIRSEEPFKDRFDKIFRK